MVLTGKAADDDEFGAPQRREAGRQGEGDGEAVCKADWKALSAGRPGLSWRTGHLLVMSRMVSPLLLCSSEWWWWGSCWWERCRCEGRLRASGRSSGEPSGARSTAGSAPWTRTW